MEINLPDHVRGARFASSPKLIYLCISTIAWFSIVIYYAFMNEDYDWFRSVAKALQEYVELVDLDRNGTSLGEIPAPLNKPKHIDKALDEYGARDSSQDLSELSDLDGLDPYSVGRKLSVIYKDLSVMVTSKYFRYYGSNFGNVYQHHDKRLKHVTAVICKKKNDTIQCTTLYQFLCFCGYVSKDVAVLNPFYLRVERGSAHLLLEKTFDCITFDVVSIKSYIPMDMPFMCNQGM